MEGFSETMVNHTLGDLDECAELHIWTDWGLNDLMFELAPGLNSLRKLSSRTINGLYMLLSLLRSTSAAAAAGRLWAG